MTPLTTILNTLHPSDKQFERLGFFVVDKDSLLPSKGLYDPLSCQLVFNLTVTLKDSKPKILGAPTKSRKDEQAKALADKMVSMLVHALIGVITTLVIVTLTVVFIVIILTVIITVVVTLLSP